MGYVGIPAAALFADSPTTEFVWGIQRNSAASGYKIDWLNRGQSPLVGKEPGLQRLLLKVVKSNKFLCTSDPDKLRDADAVIIAVETGFSDGEKLIPDNSALEEALRSAGKHLSPGSLVIIESTVTPGTTEGLARQILERESGLEAGADFGLAHVPERVMPGKLLRNLREYDRIIGGIDSPSTERAAALYLPIMTKGRILTMSAKAAEVTKTSENALRDLQISAANQLALYCEVLGINFYDVRKGIASLKGEGISREILFPGAGVGGHCLPKDTYHLEKSVKNPALARQITGSADSLFLLARRINDSMPHHMLRLTLSSLEKAGKSAHGARIGILGWAYNKNTKDARNTPALPYRDLVRGRGMEVKIHDPFASSDGDIPIFRRLETVVRSADVIAILTEHDAYKRLDLKKIRKLMDIKSPVIIDGRNVVDAKAALENGFIFSAIGRGDLN